MSDENAFDEIKAAGWSQGYEDGLKGTPQSPRPGLSWNLLDPSSFGLYSEAYHQGYEEGQRRIAELQTQQELDRLFDDLMNESRL